ncbi:MAG: ABC transporter permease [Anaerolineae bacterium]
MSLGYLARRIGIFLLTVWIAATINFFIPRLSGQNPVLQRLMERSAVGGTVQTGMEQMIDEYNKKFGLDQPLFNQYLTYLGDMSRLDFNYSIGNYPRTVTAIIADALPWTIGLLGTATVLMFLLGSLLGAFLTWPRAPKIAKLVTMPFVALSAIPYYLLGLVLVYIFGFRTQVLPLFGGYSPTMVPTWSWAFVGDVISHAILPVASIVLSGLGFWALSMRGMMLTVQEEDYMVMGEAKGLKQSTLFVRYAMRNAILPQITGLILSMGYIVSGSVLVELVFSYPGIGSVLYHAIRQFDYFLIQGIVFTMVVAIALGALILDLLLPLLDPRINYGRT